ncbi:peptidyl-prolyl cis-trans isomerase [Parasulfuritortus cantonensis]|uniref:Peptidyl-prolyl cis-trans isomerase n=1 Tax=Parasulfuritortus cantonensis TaxID=2528202 RepID=A0A4R1B2J0_9PROT|nr:peptidylprolyl isomerase [Parasulfuritortus cantonensis]TCJ12282.1 peptidyl-prolyl cis-trans isomerase [Parasulfuritortus cantonensis]
MLKTLFAILALFAAGLAQAGNPEVEIRTNLGAVTVELYPDKAPETVRNFLDYVRAGQYDGTVFHRVIAGFMIQGGGYDQALRKKATRAPIRNEAANGLGNERYTVAMARTGDPHSATAQFFINVADNAFLNYRSADVRGYGYAVFGRVVRGREVVDRIAALATGAAGPFESDVPEPAVVMTAVRLLEPAVR